MFFLLIISGLRSSHRSCFIKNGVLKNFAKFSEKTHFDKSPTKPQACNFIKKRLWHSCFSMSFVKKKLRKPFSQNISLRLLLCFSRFACTFLLRMLFWSSAYLLRLNYFYNFCHCFSENFHGIH